MIELSHRMDQGLGSDTASRSVQVPSTPPRRVPLSSCQSSLVSEPPSISPFSVPMTSDQPPAAPIQPPSTPIQPPSTPIQPPSTPPKIPSTPVHSGQPPSISPRRFSLSNPHCNENEEEILSISPVNSDQFLILPSINRISLLYAAITFSPYTHSLLTQLDLLLKLLQCGLSITYAHDRWLASFEPWRSLPKCILKSPF